MAVLACNLTNFNIILFQKADNMLRLISILWSSLTSNKIIFTSQYEQLQAVVRNLWNERYFPALEFKGTIWCIHIYPICFVIVLSRMWAFSG